MIDDDILRMPANPGTFYGNCFWTKTKRPGGKWMSREEAIAVCIEEGIESGKYLNDRRKDDPHFILKYPALPTSPIKCYNDPDFFKTVRKSIGRIGLRDIEWMSKEEAILVCVKEGIENDAILQNRRKSDPSFKHKYKRLHCSPASLYKDPSFYKEVRGLMGRTAQRDIKWMSKEEAISVCIKEGIESGKYLLDMRADLSFRLKYPTMHSDPIQYYKDTNFFKTVRKSTGGLRRSDIKWMSKEEAISVCAKEDITSTHVLQSRRKDPSFKIEYPTLISCPIHFYKDPDFFKVVRESIGRIALQDIEWISKEEAILVCASYDLTCVAKLSKKRKDPSFRSSHPRHPADPGKTYNDPDFFKKVRAAI
jgi:hypothetical protein